jgi:hypothetical protein
MIKFFQLEFNFLFSLSSVFTKIYIPNKAQGIKPEQQSWHTIATT